MWGARYWGRFWGRYWGKGSGSAPIPPPPPVPGSDPQITAHFSFDGGKTFGNEFDRSMGKRGEYKQQIVWNGLGSGSDFVLEVYGSDPVKIALTGATLDIEALKSSSRGAASPNGPKASFRFSPDGGETFGNSLERSMGMTGEYTAAVSWNAFGTSRDGVFEVFGTDAVKIALTGANMDIEVLKS